MHNYKLDKTFWKNYRNQPDYNDFELHIITKIICGEDLMDFNEDRIYMLLWDMALTNKMNEDDFKLKIKKFNQSIPNFLEKLREILIQADKNATETYKANVRILERKLNLPEYGYEWDSDEVLDFIRKLEDDIYSFSEAGRLLGVTRQTLTKYAKEGSHNIKTVRMNKSDYLTKESVADFYREKWEKENGSWLDRL